MNKATELATTKALVKAILEQCERARNSDSFLYLKLIDIISAEKNMNISGVSVIDFLLHMKEWEFPPFESVRRARQKLQREFPELSANRDVQECRDENEFVFNAFARGEVG